tara:strand:- start:431 stop:814 length:384 start_codon:yes stop_codon:yes gene_type:complete
MPRLPVDGKKVIEYRVTLGGVEREALKSLVMSQRIDALAGENGILDELGSIDDIIAKLAVIGFVLELLGITDIFNFDDDGRAKAYSILKKIGENAEESGVVRAAGGATLDTLLEILSLGRIDTDLFG